MNDMNVPRAPNFLPKDENLLDGTIRSWSREQLRREVRIVEPERPAASPRSPRRIDLHGPGFIASSTSKRELENPKGTSCGDHSRDKRRRRKQIGRLNEDIPQRDSDSVFIKNDGDAVPESTSDFDMPHIRKGAYEDFRSVDCRNSDGASRGSTNSVDSGYYSSGYSVVDPTLPLFTDSGKRRYRDRKREDSPYRQRYATSEQLYVPQFFPVPLPPALEARGFGYNRVSSRLQSFGDTRSRTSAYYGDYARRDLDNFQEGRKQERRTSLENRIAELRRQEEATLRRLEVLKRVEDQVHRQLSSERPSSSGKRDDSNPRNVDHTIRDVPDMEQAQKILEGLSLDGTERPVQTFLCRSATFCPRSQSGNGFHTAIERKGHEMKAHPLESIAIKCAHCAQRCSQLELNDHSLCKFCTDISDDRTASLSGPTTRLNSNVDQSQSATRGDSEQKGDVNFPQRESPPPTAMPPVSPHIPAATIMDDFPPGCFFPGSRGDSDDAEGSWESTLPPSHIVVQAESSDGDISTWSDFSEPEPELNKASLDALERFRPILLKILMVKFRFRQQASRTRAPSSHDNTTASSRSYTSRPSQRGSRQGGSNCLKRTSDEFVPRDNGDEDKENPRKKMYQLPEDVQDQRLLACPFCKNNPRRYRKCYTAVLRDISRMKQHLRRNHRVPIHCFRCFETFETEESLRNHLRSQSCSVEPTRQLDGINEDQKRQLEQRVSSRNSMEKNWYIIYEILFPGAERPRSPYVDPPLSDEILDLEDFSFREGPSIIEELVRTQIPPEFQPRQLELQAFTQSIFQDGVGLLLRRYATRSPSLAFSHRSNGSGGSDSGFGSDSAPAANPGPSLFTSLGNSAFPAIPGPSGDWNTDQFLQGVGVGMGADEASALDEIGNWNFDEPWNFSS